VLIRIWHRFASSASLSADRFTFAWVTDSSTQRAKRTNKRNENTARGL